MLEAGLSVWAEMADWRTLVSVAVRKWRDCLVIFTNRCWLVHARYRTPYRENVSACPRWCHEWDSSRIKAAPRSWTVTLKDGVNVLLVLLNS